jgi:ComF family protein
MAQSYSNKAFLNTLLTDFIALLYPELCVACENVLFQKEHIICLECQLELPITKFENYIDNPVEKLFWNKIEIKEATSGFFFHKKSRIQKLIHSFKYHGNIETAIFMGEQLGLQLKNSTRFKNIDLIIPVPLHPSKLKKRGYNQSEKLAIGISNILNLPVVTEVLIRNTDNTTQTKKAIFSRWTNVESVFTISQPESLEHKNILLIDDVITSGATIESCAQQILKVKYTTVSIASLAIADY